MMSRAILIALAAVCLATTGCQPRPAPVLASADDESAVRTIKPPPSDRARLYIFVGRRLSGTVLGPPYVRHRTSGDIFIDGVKIGSVNPDEALVVDIIPGKHALHWDYL